MEWAEGPGTRTVGDTLASVVVARSSCNDVPIVVLCILADVPCSPSPRDYTIGRVPGRVALR